MDNIVNFDVFLKTDALDNDRTDTVLHDIKRYAQHSIRLKSGAINGQELINEYRARKKYLQKAVDGIFKMNDNAKNSFGKSILNRRVNICDLEECKKVIDEILEEIASF